MFAWVTLGLRAPVVRLGSGSPGSRVDWLDEGVGAGAPLGPAMNDAPGASVASDSSSASVASGVGTGLAIGVGLEVAVAVAVAVAAGDRETVGDELRVAVDTLQAAAIAPARRAQAISRVPVPMPMRNLRPRILGLWSALQAYDSATAPFGRPRPSLESPVGYDRPMKRYRRSAPEAAP
jgi:hypothetical protein